MFIEEALCVALHPSAHSVLVGFTDKLRLFTVLLDDFKCAKNRDYGSGIPKLLWSLRMVFVAPLCLT